MSFYNTTIVIRVVGTAWEQLDPRLEGAARVLGASTWRAFWEVTLPLLRPALLSALLLVFMFDFTSFGVILLLGGPRFATIEVEIYIQALQMLNLPLAGLLSAVQLVFTLLLTVAYSRLAGKRSIPLAPRVHGEGMRKAEHWRDAAGRLVCGVGSGGSAGFAAGCAGGAFGDPSGSQSRRARRVCIWLYAGLLPGTVYQPARIAFLCPARSTRRAIHWCMPGSPLFSRWDWGFWRLIRWPVQARINRLLDPLLMLPLGASAVTLGLGFIVTFNRPPLDVRSFPWLIPIAHSLVALPFVVRTLQPALASIPVSLRQAAAVLGASPWQVWREVDLPIVARAALVSAIFSFTISLGEFGATSFLARPEYPTLPVAIFRFLSQPGALNYGQALAMATLLMLVCALSILVLEQFRPAGESDF